MGWLADDQKPKAEGRLIQDQYRDCHIRGLSCHTNGGVGAPVGLVRNPGPGTDLHLMFYLGSCYLFFLLVILSHLHMIPNLQQCTMNTRSYRFYVLLVSVGPGACLVRGNFPRYLILQPSQTIDTSLLTFCLDQGSCSSSVKSVISMIMVGRDQNVAAWGLALTDQVHLPEEFQRDLVRTSTCDCRTAIYSPGSLEVCPLQAFRDFVST